MSIYGLSFVDKQLSRKTSILGLRLWILISIIAGSVILLTLLLSCLCFSSCRRRRRRNSTNLLHRRKSTKLFPRLKSPEHPQNHVSVTPVVPQEIAPEVAAPKRGPESQIKAEKKTELRVLVDSDRTPSNTASVGRRGPPPPPQPPPGVPHLGWLQRYTLREIEVATKGLSGGNVIGEGGHGIVYRGVLEDDTIVAVKNLSNNSGQAEKEFKVELAVIGRVKHKNLVKLLGYCVEGAYRMLVYEYVENGNLDDWLHGHIGVSPLTWNIRMNIILGTAKGLAYLHESLEPKVVHRNIKSSNILLDREWKPKMSDFGLAKLLDSENTHVTTRVMGTHGYIAPEYAWTGMLNEKSDTYSFGILIMEIISGRCPVDHSRPDGEVNLIDWLKTMVENRKSEEVVDPKLPEMPSSKALKHVLLVALMCVDPNASERPKMGQVIHMLEEVDLLLRHESRFDREHTRAHRDYKQQNHQSFNLR
ncbi:probable serine/threonine-protein kinase At1g01540 [Rhododendron vialii]|uniref:probable serine/threonine-protein kinase At1g01540 n=1 Tax=Rhododendron vialii TaxID=182163 RepID=UPI00265E5157|nr:probable serine/threonine-protein kinase At1g01540 [Rhododendron vialii]